MCGRNPTQKLQLSQASHVFFNKCAQPWLLCMRMKVCNRFTRVHKLATNSELLSLPYIDYASRQLYQHIVEHGSSVVAKPLKEIRIRCWDQ